MRQRWLFIILSFLMVAQVGRGAAMDPADVSKLDIFKITNLAERRHLPASVANDCLTRMEDLSSANETGTVAYAYRVIGDNFRDMLGKYPHLLESVAIAYIKAYALNKGLPAAEKDTEFLRNLELMGVTRYTIDEIKRALLASLKSSI